MIRKTIIVSLFIGFFLNGISQSTSQGVSVIPQPVAVQTGNGSFILKKTSAIEIATSDSDARRVASFLSKKLSAATGYPVPVRSSVAKSKATGSIRLVLSADTTMGAEGYKLQVMPTSVVVTASKPA